MTFERKTLRNIYGSVIEDKWPVRTAIELENLYENVIIGTFVKLQRCGWMGYLQRADDAGNTKKIYQPTVHQKRPKWRPKARRKDDVENGIRKMGIVNWRQISQERYRLRRATREALILLG